LCYSPKDNIGEDSAAKILKKRTINGETMMPVFLDEIPKIFWVVNNGKNWTKNYKGVIIISTDEQSRAVCSERGVSFEKI
jgi:hypothetical protein